MTNSQAPLIECIPNFSEGRDSTVIEQIACAIRNISNVKLLEIDTNEDANRTVITFAGAPEAVCEAAFQGIKRASELIDMSKQTGAHPRIGATDVCPLVPLQGISMDETVKFAHQLAQRVAEQLEIPIYCYENAALKPERKNLAFIRKGQYEGLKEKMKNTDFLPDFGKAVFNAQAGATVIGAREILIAYNFNLNTTSVEIAKKIANEIRESGSSPHKLKYVKAIGWYMKNYQIAQVSTNLTNFRETPVHLVFETINKIAEKYKVKITGSELVGLIPLKALALPPSFPELQNLQDTIQYFGLDALRPFYPEKKVIELLLGIEEMVVLKM
jgi:glutamate formiminotransferase/formiminotetrahydrofolate cyclodeaminase